MAKFSISARKRAQLMRSAKRAGEESCTLTVVSEKRPATLRLQWLAKDKTTALGEAFELEAGEGQAEVETFHPSGAISHVMRPLDLDFDADVPRGAKYLHLSQGGASDTIAISTLARPSPQAPQQHRRFHSRTARFVFPVFAERFTDPAPFFAAVDALYQWIMALEPFRADGMPEIFALHGYYWTTDPQRGQFNATDNGYDCASAATRPAVTFSGSNPDAKAALGHLMLGGKYGLVLINSSIRGGAGGLAREGYPAWASITACPGERWEAVALHEIAHALGLADEYLDSRLQVEKWDREPNCAAPGDAVPWQTEMSPPFDGLTNIYSLADQAILGRPGGRPDPGRDFVALFQGARYRSDYFRPSSDCLMRNTRCLRFCRICQRAIKARMSET